MSVRLSLTNCSRVLAAIFLACLMAAANAFARDLTGEEDAKLAQATQSFGDAIAASDYDALVKAIPPRIVKQMAKHDGVSEDEISKALAELVGASMAAMPVKSFALKLPDAEHKELADGTPYLLIPTDTVMDAGGADKVLMRAPTLALIDGSEWYLLRTTDAQLVSALREAYPDYAGVDFPQATIEPVKE